MMPQELEYDPQAELIMHRRKLSTLEDEQRQIKRQLVRVRGSASSRGLQFSAIFLALFLGAIGTPYAQNILALFVDGKGNVGIHTQTPSGTLDVNGDLLAKSLDVNGTIRVAQEDASVRGNFFVGPRGSKDVNTIKLLARGGLSFRNVMTTEEAVQRSKHLIDGEVLLYVDSKDHNLFFCVKKTALHSPEILKCGKFVTNIEHR
jgi:hypothetical protein